MPDPLWNRPFSQISARDLDRRLKDQVSAGRVPAPRPSNKPTYYVAYEYVDGTYRPVAAADSHGTVNVSFDQAVYSEWSDEENLTWLRRRVDQIVHVGKVR